MRARCNDVVCAARSCSIPDLGVVLAYWWCLKDSKVEGDIGCANADRLGPFDTEAEAANALQKAKERNEAWDQDDKNWNGTS